MTPRFEQPALHTELRFKTSRSGGKGGQNVNKVSSKVQVSFSIPASALLTEEEKEMLLQKLAAKLSTEGELQVVSQADRTQLGNKEIAVKKLYAAINKCFVVPRKRKATRASKASVEKRLQSKKHHSETKRMRRTTD